MFSFTDAGKGGEPSSSGFNLSLKPPASEKSKPSPSSPFFFNNTATPDRVSSSKRPSTFEPGSIYSFEGKYAQTPVTAQKILLKIDDQRVFADSSQYKANRMALNFSDPGSGSIAPPESKRRATSPGLNLRPYPSPVDALPSLSSPTPQNFNLTANGNAGSLGRKPAPGLSSLAAASKLMGKPPLSPPKKSAQASSKTNFAAPAPAPKNVQIPQGPQPQEDQMADAGLLDEEPDT
jgi:hypothetical protein